MVLFMRDNHPGALLEILEQFASRGVNLCRIESRPTKRSLGDYCFSVDAEGHIDDARLAEAMMGLHRVCGDVVFLGSYPRADLTEPIIQHGTSNEDVRRSRDLAAEVARLTAVAPGTPTMPGARRLRKCAVGHRELVGWSRYPEPQRGGHNLSGQRIALTDGVAVELKSITLLYRDGDPVSCQPIQLIVGLSAPRQDPGRQPDPVAERAR